MEYRILSYETPIGKGGVDVNVQFVDKDKGIDAVVRFWWEKGGQPTLKDMQERLTHIGNNLIRKQQESAAEFLKPSTLNREEINVILREKGYLESDEDLNDLKSKDELISSERTG